MTDGCRGQIFISLVTDWSGQIRTLSVEHKQYVFCHTSRNQRQLGPKPGRDKILNGTSEERGLGVYCTTQLSITFGNTMNERAMVIAFRVFPTSTAVTPPYSLTTSI